MKVQNGAITCSKLVDVLIK